MSNRKSYSTRVSDPVSRSGGPPTLQETGRFVAAEDSDLGVDLTFEEFVPRRHTNENTKT